MIFGKYAYAFSLSLHLRRYISYDHYDVKFVHHESPPRMVYLGVTAYDHID